MRRWAPVLLVVAGLIVVGIAAQGSGLQWGERDLDWERPTQEAEELFIEDSPTQTTEALPQPQDEEGAQLPPWVSWLLLAIFVGVPAALLLVFLTRRIVSWLIRSEITVPEVESETHHQRRDIRLVEEAVAAGLSEIDVGTDPRSAIMACWVHFERASEAVGISREASDTPSDLVQKLLDHHDLERSSLSRLSGAYLRARYSPHDVDETDRDRARDALVDLQRQLGVREAR
ncbi:DUF4129 domain-containing protein [Glycomyces xiaoerkulensis]|uniref:DUF4129 domain-containing protein n=1 Tax=Glycomyces xiaoerkulensis TaxID=2038139 RepID=UPI0012FFDEF0|nr:DUF4129 domain-containing protein [Glycomyces xiaoerkulensis]